MTASRGIGRGNGERLRAAPRCGARTRKGTACAAPRCHGRPRCRMHGGAARSGAPVGNRNALKDGFYTAAERARRRAMNAFIADMNAAVALSFPPKTGPLFLETEGGCDGSETSFRRGRTEAPARD